MHILYVEYDGDPTKNLKAFEKIVRYMHDQNAGYFAINHPVDRCPSCGYTGIIDNKCPSCDYEDTIAPSVLKVESKRSSEDQEG